VSTGNFTGRLPVTTVFSQPGNEAAARTLARQFPKVTAVEPAPTSLKTGTVLTVVLTRYFAG
jgi:hypothetical protein